MTSTKKHLLVLALSHLGPPSYVVAILEHQQHCLTVTTSHSVGFSKEELSLTHLHYYLLTDNCASNILGPMCGEEMASSAVRATHHTMYLSIVRMMLSSIGMLPDLSCMALSSGNSWRMAVASWSSSAWARPAEIRELEVKRRVSSLAGAAG